MNSFTCKCISIGFSKKNCSYKQAQYIFIKSQRNTATISQVRNESYLLLISITSVEVPQRGANDPATRMT